MVSGQRLKSRPGAAGWPPAYYSNPIRVVKRSRAFRRPYPAKALTPHNNPKRIAILNKYQPVDATRPPLADREDDLRTALRWLAEKVLIIRFSAEDDPADWVFRSRIAETVRLLSKLRQRLAFDNTAKQRQRISHGKRLTGMELAIAVGLSPKSKGFISEIESGKKCPNVELVLQIAKHFGVSTDYLLRDDIPV